MTKKTKQEFDCVELNSGQFQYLNVVNNVIFQHSNIIRTCEHLLIWFASINQI